MTDDVVGNLIWTRSRHERNELFSNAANFHYYIVIGISDRSCSFSVMADFKDQIDIRAREPYSS